MKYEWKKQEKYIYAPKEEPTIVDIKEANFICIDGKGNPNNEDFQKRIEVLYTLSYAIRMSPRKGINIPGYFEYTVYPLEGFWDLTEKGRKSEVLLKDELVYTIMIKQPSFVTKEVFDSILKTVKETKDNQLLDEAYFKTITEGLSVQIMHIGPYDDEKRSFDKMKEFLKTTKYEIKTLVHKEIYIGDPRKSSPEKLKTILRYHIKEKE